MRFLRPYPILLFLALLLLTTASVAYPSPPPFSSPTSFPSTLVYLAPGARPDIDWVPIYGQPDVYAVRNVPLAVLKLDRRVIKTEPNLVITVDPKLDEFNEGIQPFTVSDPMVDQQYALAKMRVPDAWATAKGNGVIIAVVDTGVDFTHPDLAGKFVSRGRDFVNGDNDATDDHGHGTHVSGIAAAATDNRVGVAGVAWNAQVLPVKVLNANGSGDMATIASGIAWAADNGAKVINLSLGGSGGAAVLENAVNYAWNKGAVVVCAAGNTGSSSPQYPAVYANCVSVSATDAADRLASFSTYGPGIDVAAPGHQILSTVRGGRYESWSGTSMAAPNVSGVVALIWSAHPTWTNTQVRSALENSTDPIGAATYFGKGRVNAAKAVGSPTGPTLTPAPTSIYPTPTPATGLDAQIEEAINAQRKANGLAPVTNDPALTRIARQHNQWMDDHDCFAHDCPGEPNVWQRLAGAGYPYGYGSEVIARGYDTVTALVQGWMNSSGHRAILLGTAWNRVGCAWDEWGNSYLARWQTCDFGRAAGSPTATPPANRAYPPGWFLTIEVPYDTSTQAQIDALYWNVCFARQADGVRCDWKQYRRLEEHALLP